MSDLVTYPQGQEGHIFLPSAICAQKGGHELSDGSDLWGDFSLSFEQSSKKLNIRSLTSTTAAYCYSIQ